MATDFKPRISENVTGAFSLTFTVNLYGKKTRTKSLKITDSYVSTHSI